MKKIILICAIMLIFSFGCDNGDNLAAENSQEKNHIEAIESHVKNGAEDVTDAAKEGLETVKGAARSGAEAVSDKAHEGFEEAKKNWGEMKENVSEAAHGAKEHLKEDAVKAQEVLSQTGHHLSEGVKQGADKAVEHGKEVIESLTETTSVSTHHSWETKLAHHNFILKELDGKDFSHLKNPDGSKNERQPNMDFTQWPHLAGKMCNNYNGQVEIKDDVIKMPMAAATKMLCADEELNKLEQVFFKSMAEGLHMTYENNTLRLKNKEHDFVLVLSDHL